jgi:hypothetical protein
VGLEIWWLAVLPSWKFAPKAAMFALSVAAAAGLGSWMLDGTIQPTIGIVAGGFFFLGYLTAFSDGLDR